MLNRRTAERLFPADRKARLEREHQAHIKHRQQTTQERQEMTAIDRAREAQRKIKGLATEVQTAIHGLDSIRDQRVADAIEERHTGRPPISDREKFDRTEQAKDRLLSTVRGANDRLEQYQAELAQALTESGAVAASDPARQSVRAQLQAGVPASAILDDAQSRYDVDTVRAVRAEVGGFLMAKAGSNQTARAEAIKGRERIERAADRVLARMGSDAERDVAQLRIGSGVLVESARQLADKAGQYAAKGDLKAEDRLSLAYAQSEADRAVA